MSIQARKYDIYLPLQYNDGRFFEQKMIASKKENPVLKRSNRIRRGVENRLSPMH